MQNKNAGCADFLRLQSLSALYFSQSLHGNPLSLMLYYIQAKFFSALCAGREVKSFAPEPFVPKLMKVMIAGNCSDPKENGQKFERKENR